MITKSTSSTITITYYHITINQLILLWINKHYQHLPVVLNPPHPKNNGRERQDGAQDDATPSAGEVCCWNSAAQSRRSLAPNWRSGKNWVLTSLRSGCWNIKLTIKMSNRCNSISILVVEICWLLKYMAVSEYVVYPIVPNGFADHYPYEQWLLLRIYPIFRQTQI